MDEKYMDDDDSKGREEKNNESFENSNIVGENINNDIDSKDIELVIFFDILIYHIWSQLHYRLVGFVDSDCRKLWNISEESEYLLREEVRYLFYWPPLYDLLKWEIKIQGVRCTY